MDKIIFLAFLLVLSWSAVAQDERTFRQIFSGEILKETVVDKTKEYSYVIHTPYYALDINNDQKNEFLAFVKKDGEDWLEIFDIDKKKIFSYQLETKGFGSELFKIERRSLSDTTVVLILYYYEGVTRYIDFQGTTRIYAITLDKNDLTTLAPFKGPSFFEEKRTLKWHYHKRHYDVLLEDLNNDSVKELIIKSRNISEVFLYAGNGKWKTYNQNQNRN